MKTKQPYLLRFGFYGIKNIKENVELSFYKKTVDKNFNPEEFRIKSIYGENGSGKTAIITAVDILRKIILLPNYLSDSKTQELLNHIVNKETKEFKLYAEFCIVINEIPKVFYYEIKVIKNHDDGLFIIKQEILKFKNATYYGAATRTLYVVENGEFKELNTNDSDMLINKTMNLLNMNSAVSIMRNIYMHYLVDNELDDMSTAIMLLYLSALSLQTFLNAGDDHSLFYIKKNIEELNKVERIKEDEISDALKQMTNVFNSLDNRIRKDDIGKYEEDIIKLTRFIKVFKSSLKNIEVDKKDLDEDHYKVSLVFDYGKYRVDQEFESTGIKNLIRIYKAIDLVSKGFIVFIDEFDANINSIFFDKLIEYVQNYTDGQLCFTAHNTSSMDLLKEQKDSINFLTYDNKIIKWTKNGHYAPDVLYRNGMIEGMPFNIYASDFVDVFEDDNV